MIPVANPFFIPLLAGALLGLMLIAPTAFSPIKLVMLLMLIGGVVTSRMFGSRPYRVDMNIARLAGFYALLGTLFAFIGAINGGPGALAVLTTYLVWPVAFTMLLGILHDPGLLTRVDQIFAVSSMLIAVYILLFSLSMAGFISPTWVPRIYDEAQSGFSVGEGYVEVSVRQLASLLFLGPYFLALYVAWPREHKPPISKAWMLLILGACAIVSAFGGRRALLLALLTGAVFTMTLVCFQPTSQRRASRRQLNSLALYLFAILAIAVLSFSYYFNFDSLAYLDFLLTGLDFDSDRSAVARRDQLNILINGWADRPFFGYGQGTSVHGLLRSATHPWAYELSYVALLFHTGLVGFACYAGGIVWIVWQGLRLIRAGGTISAHMLAALVGMLSFLTGNATNPYLEKFDFMFVIFYPTALINLYRLRGPVSRGKEYLSESITA